MKSDLKAKLKTLPNSPGVYFYKSAKGEVIYVGKAAILKNRVRQYFQNPSRLDIKTRALVTEIENVDWLTTDSEIDALFLEAEMIKRYMPRYNILLRDDKALTYIRIDMKSDYPFVSFTRNPSDDEAEYFGPYYSASVIKKAMRYLRRVFPYYILSRPISGPNPDKQKLSLDDHIGLNPTGMSSGEYKANLRKLISYIKGNRAKLVKDLTKEMKQSAKAHDFEQAAILRNKLNGLRALQKQIMFGDKEFLDISKDEALSDLTKLLELPNPPVRIEGYDISHISGVDAVASMVVFKNGVSDRSQYRKFKLRIDRNNDFENMHEVIKRRLSEKNILDWGKPDLVLIDGGKGQLTSAIRARNELGMIDIPFIGLAKREEQIVLDLQDRVLVQDSILQNQVKRLGGSMIFSDNFALIDLPHNSHIIKLLERIRDESHRFALNYQTTLRRTRQTADILSEIPTIGPKTRSKLIRKFGSLKGVKNASEDEVVALIGKSKAKLVKKSLSEYN